MTWKETRCRELAAALESAGCPEELKAGWLAFYKGPFLRLIVYCTHLDNRIAWQSVGELMGVFRWAIEDYSGAAMRREESTIKLMDESGLRPDFDQLRERHPASTQIMVSQMMADLSLSWPSESDRELDWPFDGRNFHPIGWRRW